ncbi:MAG: hypothetical protein GY754_44090 [bacterium]|nr:hypothetical protein [bacterium]
MKNLLNSAVFTLMAAVIAFSGCEAGLSQGSDSSSNDEKFSFSEMYSTIDKLQDEIDDLKTANAVLAEALGVSGENQSSVINTLNSRIDTLESSFTSLNTTVGNNTTSLDNLNTTFEGVSRSGDDIAFSGTFSGATRGFGGMFQKEDYGAAEIANPYTGATNCPSGFTAYGIARFAHAETQRGTVTYACLR